MKEYLELKKDQKEVVKKYNYEKKAAQKEKNTKGRVSKFKKKKNNYEFTISKII